MAKPQKEDAMNAQKIMTPEFRVSYPHVFKTSQMGKGEPKYSITMLFPKDGDLSVLKSAIKAAKSARFGSKDKWPDEIDSPVVDGDLPKYADKDGYAGHYVIKATSQEISKPSVFDEDGDPLMDQAALYPGCYARAKLFANVWEFPKDSGKFGVQFILDGVQKTGDGDPFGGRGPVSFDPVSGGKKKSKAKDGEDEEDDEQDFK